MDSKNRLFHGTGIYALAAIIEDNVLKEGIHWGKPGEPHGPRTSESFEIASDFITYNVHWGEGGVIVLDRDALNKDYNLLSYRDSMYSGELMSDEKEVAILTSSVTNLNKYIVSIVCSPDVINLAHDIENMQAAIQECGWSFSQEGEAGYAEARSALKALMEHPKLNAWVPDTGYPLHSNWELPKSSDSGRSLRQINQHPK